MVHIENLLNERMRTFTDGSSHGALETRSTTALTPSFYPLLSGRFDHAKKVLVYGARTPPNETIECVFPYSPDNPWTAQLTLRARNLEAGEERTSASRARRQELRDQLLEVWLK